MRSSKILIAATVLLAASQAGADEYNVYFGNLHAHTSYSDGKLTPYDADVYARDVAKLDFQAVTDHEERMMPDVRPDTWEKEKTQADEVNEDGRFVAIAGYEWGSPIFNHSNFFRTDHFFSIDCYIDPNINLLYNEIKRVVKTQNPPPIMQFNHPDWDPVNPANYNNYAYDPVVASIAHLMEIKQPDHELSYREALTKGWRLSPVFNQDNHDADWGTQNDCRAALWMKSLTREGLYEAMAAGRSYSTCAKKAVVSYKGNGRWMGEIVNTAPITLEWSVEDQTPGNIFHKVELISSDGTIVDTASVEKSKASGTFTVDPAGIKEAYYLRISMSAPNGKPAEPMIYTAPIYFEESAADGGMPDGSSTDGGPEPQPSSGGCSIISLSL